MSIRSTGLILFLVAVLIIIQRDRASHSITVHTPAPVSFTLTKSIKISKDNSSTPYYATGPIWKQKLPAVSPIERLTRKKIQNFVFNHYNHYKVELTFVDLGYASNFMFNFFAQGYPHYSAMEIIGFDLSEKMLDGSLNLDIHKKQFNLTVRQYVDQANDETITTFNLSFIRKQSNINANLTHILRNKECFTAIRKGNTVSHKCMGGIGSGKVKIDHIIHEKDAHSRRQSNMLNPSFNLTRVVYDGLRGSGMHWRWVWGIMSGFSKPEFYALNHTIPKQHSLGLNFGHIFGQGQDFAFLSGRVIPIQGLQYQFPQSVDIGTNITVTAKKPLLQATFTVMNKEHKLEDMGIVKLDMVKIEGNWAGYIEDEAHGRTYDFYQIAGLMESCDSLF